MNTAPDRSVVPFASTSPEQLSVPLTAAFATGWPLSRLVTQARLLSRPHLKCTAMMMPRAAERRACQFDDVESRLRQRDADDLEILALARQPDLHRGAGIRAGQDRLRSGVLDVAGDLVALLDVIDVVFVGAVAGAQPFGDLAVGPVDAQRLP